MDRKTIMEMLILLNSHDLEGFEEDLGIYCDTSIKSTCTHCGIDLENVIPLNVDLNRFNPNDVSVVWKYVCLNFYFLDLLRDSLDNTPSNDVLSVQQLKSLKVVIKNVVLIGICCNLQPKMPGYRQSQLKCKESNSILISYNRLAATTFRLITYLKCLKLRGVILSDSFKPILSSLYQIIYCPLKKPDVSGPGNSSFVMTPELYARFVEEKEIFATELEHLENSLWKTLYVKETMLLPQNNTPPLWFIKAIAQNLNRLICSPKGVETITWAMMNSSADYDPDDRGKNWKALDVIAKLIVNLRTNSEFKSLICGQLSDLFNSKDHNGKYVAPFEDLFVLCVKKLFVADEDACLKILLPEIFDQCRIFTDKIHKFDEDEKVTDRITRIIRLLYACFVESSSGNLPISLLTPCVGVLVVLYSVMANTSLNMGKELREILLKYLRREEVDKHRFFDLFLFDIPAQGITKFRDDIYLEYELEDLVVRKSDFKNFLDIDTKKNAIRELCTTEVDLAPKLFVYLLNVIVEREKYSNPASSNKDLLEIEDEFVLDESSQRNLFVYGLLTEIAENSLILAGIQENPVEIVRFLQNFLQNILDSGIHRQDECDSKDFQTTFTVILTLQALVMQSEMHDHFKSLLNVLRSLFEESINVEIRNLVKSILDVLDDQSTLKKRSKQKPKSEFEKALDDVLDPMLPVKGHGIMTFSKLVQCKNPEALERKNYILHIFQQNLGHEDSFIYLSSINGLADMGNLFPDAVLNLLTDEYSDFARKDSEDGLELRMKVGEVLVRITKTLGQMAPKYKSLLLNTFLVGCKDEDHLIRASSLSNLGEICKVLGYKLGSTVVEVLVCVHAIVTTDKAVEARRAAVTVIRQLLAGLEVEMVTFLKDHVLEIYRTLKAIYPTDKDEIMRLQAQLALEELNENVKNFLLAGPQLQADKKFVLPEINNDIKFF